VKEQESAVWTAKQERLALLLAEGKTVKDAATLTETGERTAFTWLADRRFQVFLSELRGRMLDAALGRLADAACKAVDTLVALLDEESPNVRLRAAQGILDSMGRLREHVEFERRIATLEAAHAPRTQRPTGPPRSNGIPPQARSLEDRGLGLE
jgi:hypothetical protein